MTHTADPLSRIDAARSFLFVPGNRPDRFDRAVASGADIVVIDLEDSVALDAKLEARAAVAASLITGSGRRRYAWDCSEGPAGPSY
jgi:citrate lyase subunit beta / citryl-CoA lyase